MKYFPIVYNYTIIWRVLFGDFLGLIFGSLIFLELKFSDEKGCQHMSHGEIFGPLVFGLRAQLVF